jgi:hypothetical protein
LTASKRDTLEARRTRLRLSGVSTLRRVTYIGFNEDMQKKKRSTKEELTNEQLRLVAQHGSGRLVRALATVRLLRRQGREEELQEVLKNGGVAT